MNTFRRIPAFIAALSLAAGALIPVQAAPQAGAPQAAVDKEQTELNRVPPCSRRC